MYYIQLLVILFFYLVIFAIGAWAGKREAKHQELSEENLILAGRHLPLFVGFFTMTATWVGGGYINGTAEIVFDKNQGLLWAQAPWGYAISLIIGGLFFAGIMRKHEFTTMLDPFERRYGERLTAILFLPALVGELFWSAAILTALGTTFGTILNFDMTTSILISAAFAIGYTMLGGLLAVAYTDVIQLLFILIGLIIALPFAFENSGGISTMIAQYSQNFGEVATLIPSNDMGGYIWVWFDFAFLLMLGGIPWQVYFQRVLACKDGKTARLMSFVAAGGCIIMAVPAVIIGAIGATTDWSALGIAAPENAAMILPYVLQHLTPPIIATIGLGAVAAAVMSSVDSSILSVSTMFVWNVYRPLINPEADNSVQKRVTRMTILVMGTLATLLALKVKSVSALWFLCADFVYVILFPQLVMALWNKSANQIGAVSGIVVGLILRLGGGEPTFGLPAFITYLPLAEDGTSLFPFRTFSMLMSLMSIYLVSILTQKWNKAKPLELKSLEASS